MAVNFGLLQAAQPASAFFQGQQDVQREAEQNMLRQAQMENMAAQRAERLAMTQDREALTRERAVKAAQAAKRQEFLAGLSTKMAEGGHKLDRPTLGQMLQFGMQTGEDSLIRLATEGMRALDEEDRYRQEATRLGLPGAAPAPAVAPSIMRQPAAAAPAAPTNMLAGTPFDIGVGAPAPANALVAPAAAAPAGITREMAQQMILSTNPRIREQGKALLPSLEKPPTYTPSPDMQGYELAKSEGFKGTFFDYKRQLAEAGRAPAQPKSPGSPVAVIDPATNKTIFVTPEEALTRRMTPASAGEGLAPKEIQKREAAYPKTTAALRSFETQADTLVANLTKLRDHPGLSGITGIIYGRTPAITAEARSAKADLDNILARGGFAELAAMRQASPTGGALGNISNQEVKYLRDAFGALDTVQDTDTFKQKIDDVIAQLTTSKRNVREEYDNTYEYRTTRGGGAAKPGGPRPSLDDIFK